MNTEESGRPAVMENLSDTQLQELDQNYDESDEQGFMELTKSYGWSDEDCKAVWKHFGERPNLTGGRGTSGDTAKTSQSATAEKPSGNTSGKGSTGEAGARGAQSQGGGDASFAGSGSMGGTTAGGGGAQSSGEETNSEVF